MCIAKLLVSYKLLIDAGSTIIIFYSDIKIPNDLTIIFVTHIKEWSIARCSNLNAIGETHNMGNVVDIIWGGCHYHCTILYHMTNNRPPPQCLLAIPVLKEREHSPCNE